jgi:hypothetical protein
MQLWREIGKVRDDVIGVKVAIGKVSAMQRGKISVVEPASEVVEELKEREYDDNLYRVCISIVLVLLGGLLALCGLTPIASKGELICHPKDFFELNLKS